MKKQIAKLSSILWPVFAVSQADIPVYAGTLCNSSSGCHHQGSTSQCNSGVRGSSNGTTVVTTPQHIRSGNSLNWQSLTGTLSGSGNSSKGGTVQHWCIVGDGQHPGPATTGSHVGPKNWNNGGQATFSSGNLSGTSWSHTLSNTGGSNAYTHYREFGHWLCSNYCKSGSGRTWSPGPNSTLALPGYNTGSINAQITAVINGDWQSWTGYSLSSTSGSNVLTMAQLGQLLANPNVTGSQAAVLGVIADHMYQSGLTSVTPSQVLSFMTGTGGSHSGSFYNYYMAMVQIGSATTNGTTFSLYGSASGPVLAEIEQGPLGDCFLISSIGAVLNQGATGITAIEKAITGSGNAFTVTFANGQKENVVVTDGAIAEGSLAQTNPPGTSTAGNGAWLTVLQLAEDKVLLTTPGYSLTTAQSQTPLGAIELGGYPIQTLSMLTGQSYTRINDTSKTQWTTGYISQLLGSSLSAGKPVDVSTSDHALAVTGFNSSTGTVTIWNPWGVSGTYQPESNSSATVTMTHGYFTVSLNQFLADFHGIEVQSSLISSVSATATAGSAVHSAFGGGFTPNNLGVQNLSMGGSFGSPAGTNAALNGGNIIPPANLAMQALPAISLLENQIISLQNVGDGYQLQLSDQPIEVPGVSIPEVSNSSHLVPVGFRTAAHPQLTDMLPVARDQNAQRHQLSQGSMLVMQQQRTVVTTSRADVEVAPKSAAFIIDFETNVVVSNLSDHASGDVTVLVGEQRITVPMGQAILLTGDPKSDAVAKTLSRGLGLSNLQPLAVHETTISLVGNFSYGAVLRSSPQLRNLIHSNNSAERKMVAQLLKSSAAYVTLRESSDN
jgi:hypothetical protein